MAVILQRDDKAPFRGFLLPAPLMRHYEEQATINDMLRSRLDEQAFSKPEEHDSPILMFVMAFGLGFLGGGYLFSHK